MSNAKMLAPPIYDIRGQKVIIDADLAKLCGMETKRLNEQCNRNSGKFIANCRFQPTRRELAEARSQFATLEFKADRKLPWVYNVHGAIFAVNLLKGKRAAELSINMARMFVAIYNMAVENSELEKNIIKLESGFDKKFTLFYNVINQLSETSKKEF